MVSVRKRGKVYQYQYDIAPINGKRKRITKSGFKTKAEAEKAGMIAYNEYMQTGHNYMLSQSTTSTLQEFVKEKPALKVRLPKYDIPDEDPAHIFTKEEITMILERFKNNYSFYYAVLTAYYTGLRVSEVFGLTWEDIDLILEIPY